MDFDGHPRPVVTGGVTRGVVRLLRDLGFAPLAEFKLRTGRRVDVAGLDKKGRFLFVEVKSSPEDFRADGKWPEYLDYCDWFYFAVPPGFPATLPPDGNGLIISDGFHAVVKRRAPERALTAARRRAQTLRFARLSAQRLSWTAD